MKRFKYTNLAWFCALISASLPLISYAVVFGATDQLDRIFDADEIDIQLSNSLWAATPFVMAALLSRRWSAADRTSWPLLLGIMLTFGVWAWFTFEGWHYQRALDASGGANIGLGILLMALPIATFAVVKTAESLFHRQV